jgi:nucleotide-binding universal stress UspA family protein
MDPSPRPFTGPPAPAAEPPGGRIVVGVDGSSGSVAALHWAVGEAGWRGATLQAVSSEPASETHPADPDADVTAPSPDRHTMLTQLVEAVTRASAFPDVAVSSAVIEGHPVPVLIEAARDADLLVVGSRGHGRLLGTLIGSVSQALMAHAPCPVVLVPDPEQLLEREAAHAARVQEQTYQYSEEAMRSEAQRWKAMQGRD